MDDNLLQALLAGGGLLVSALVGVLVAALRKWTAKIESETLRDLAYKGTKATRNAVLATNKAFVEAARARSADGKLSAEDAKVAGEHAWQSFKAQFGMGDFKLLTKQFGSEEAVKESFKAQLDGVIKYEKVADARIGSLLKK